MPNEKYPIDKIDEINKILADLSAPKSDYVSNVPNSPGLYLADADDESEIFPDDNSSQPIAQNTQSKEYSHQTESDFNKAVVKGDELLKMNKFQEAVSSYNSALALNPGDQESEGQNCRYERKYLINKIILMEIIMKLMLMLIIQISIKILVRLKVILNQESFKFYI